MKTINNILLVIAILICGIVAAVGILSVSESQNMTSFLLIMVVSKVIGFAALYVTCRLVAYFNKINDIVTPEL